MSHVPYRLPLTSDDPNEVMRKAITYAFAIARMYGKAEGGSVSPEIDGYADGGAPAYSAPITGPHTITAQDLIGTAPPPAGSQPGAYTDAGGQKVAAPFVTGMSGGYPVPPSGSKASPSDPTSDILASLKTLPYFSDAFESGAFDKYLSGAAPQGYAGGGRAGMLSEIVARALAVAKDVKPADRIAVTHSLDPEAIPVLANRYNGIPAPSLALSKPLAVPEVFGDATLIGKPHLAVPAEDNPVFAADAYTPRFPKHLSEPSVEDVISHVRSLPMIGGEGKTAKGVGMLKAMAHPQFGSIDDIQKSRPNLTSYGDERNDVWEDLRNRSGVLGGTFMQYGKEPTNYPADQFIDAMIDYIRRGREGLQEHYPELPQLRMIQAQNFISDLKAASPSYYEAKPLRGVGMDEFAGAVLPMHREGRDAARALVGSGIPEESIHFYNPDVTDSRLNTIRDKFKDYGFDQGGPVEGSVEEAPPEVAKALETARRVQLPDMTIAARPAPKSAHDFVTERLNSGEPQLPQYDREGVRAWQEGAKTLGHMAAYGIPVVGPALGAYDLANAARNIASPEFREALANKDYTTAGVDLANLGLSAFGAPGKLAKAAAAAGMALLPTDAEAGAGFEDGGAVDRASAFVRRLLNDKADPQLPQYDPYAGALTATQAALLGAGMAPGAGMASAAGAFPKAEGGFEPSIRENVSHGNYGQAALQALSVLGDASYLAGPIGGAVGSTLKVPAAVKLAMLAPAPIRRAEVAEDLLKKGASTDDIFGKTQLVKGSDNFWFEDVPSDEMHLNSDAQKRLEDKGRVVGPLSDIIEHDRLYQRVPSLKNVFTELRLGPQFAHDPEKKAVYGKHGYKGSYLGDIDTIVGQAPSIDRIFGAWNPYGEDANLLDLIAHEGTHAIQKHTGTSGGGNVEQFIDATHGGIMAPYAYQYQKTGVMPKPAPEDAALLAKVQQETGGLLPFDEAVDLWAQEPEDRLRYLKIAFDRNKPNGSIREPFDAYYHLQGEANARIGEMRRKLGPMLSKYRSPIDSLQMSENQPEWARLFPAYGAIWKGLGLGR